MERGDKRQIFGMGGSSCHFSYRGGVTEMQIFGMGVSKCFFASGGRLVNDIFWYGGKTFWYMEKFFGIGGKILAILEPWTNPNHHPFLKLPFGVKSVRLRQESGQLFLATETSSHHTGFSPQG